MWSLGGLAGTADAADLGRADLSDLLELASGLGRHRAVTGASYTGLGLAVLVGWIGVPGTGEVALVAAAVVASRGRLDIVLVLVLAWSGAILGGVVGWVIGLKGGRPLVPGPGPLRRARRRALAAGERVFARRPLLAVYVAPAWMAGVNRMRPAVYLPANLVAALAWTLLVGLGGYFAGRPVLDAVGDLGTVGLLLLGALVVAGVVGDRVRRRAR